MSIRPAQEKDASKLLELLKQMGYKMTNAEMQQRIQAFTSPNHHLLVMEEKNDVIAMIAFAMLRTIFKAKQMLSH